MHVHIKRNVLPTFIAISIKNPSFKCYKKKGKKKLKTIQVHWQHPESLPWTEKSG
uniref:Putative chlorophyllide b reductase NYC1ic n=1 Tax=Rhizophora mucronata TaxID=61149 RepID=A0A2P2K3N1_RHIMU